MDKKILALVAIGFGLLLFAVSIYLIAQPDTKTPEKTYTNFTQPEPVYQTQPPANSEKRNAGTVADPRTNTKDNCSAD